MVTTDTIEGTINDLLWFHYDMVADVLYIRLASERNTPTEGEQTDDGIILLYPIDGDKVIGMTVVGWWKRFGDGALPDSIRALEQLIEPWSERLAA